MKKRVKKALQKQHFGYNEYFNNLLQVHSCNFIIILYHY